MRRTTVDVTGRGTGIGVAALLLALIAPVTAVADAGTPWVPEPLATRATAGTVPSGSVTLAVVPRGSFSAAALRLSAVEAARAVGVDALPVGPRRAGAHSFQLTVPRRQADLVASRLLATGKVLTVEPVHELSLLDTPSDTLYAGSQQAYLSALDVPRAWDVTHGSSGVRVAVIDTGATVTHPDLLGKVVGRYNSVSGSSTVTDNEGHGTMVASMVAANTDNAAGIAGAGWNSDLLIVRTSDSRGVITDAAVAEGVDWAVDHGADVINLSLGGASAGTVLKTAIARAVDADVVVVAAAGNDGTSAKVYPAALPGVVAVGATSQSGLSRASFSQFGAWVDVAAPGVGIVGASRTGAGYDSGDGTSFASPLVAGVAALIRASRPTLSAAGVRSALSLTASSSNLGFAKGRIDAYKALGYKLVLPGPDVVSPAPGDTVGSSMDVQVTVPGSVGADHVKVQVVGAAGSVSTALSSGAATPHLQTWGRLGDQVLRVVACRQTLCSSSGTDVPIHVAYSAPTLTAPTGGEAFTSDWTASASSTAPAVRFVDEAGHTLATDTSEPFSATIPLGRLTSGAHTVYAVACDATGKVCDPAPATGGADITVSRLDPRLTNITPLPFSPNGDGRRDSTKATYVLDVASTTTVTVTAASGATVRSVSLGSLTAGTHSWTWNGRNDAGQVVAGGRYVVHVNTSTTAPALTGTSSRGVTVDLVHPSVTSVATTYPTVFPIVDGYRDSTHLSARISEPATVVIRVLKSSGATAWSWRAWRSRAGAVSAVWDGGSSDGHALPAGTYRVQVQATDLAGNRTTAAAKSVSISQRKAVKRTWTHTSTAASVSGGGYQATDSASTVSFYDPFGSGALRFHASATGRVRTVNRLALRSAVAYVSVRVDAYARGVGGGQAYLAFIDDAGHEVHGATLSSSTGTHHGHVASATASLLDGHKARWELVVSGGDTYDVRSFTVTLTYLVLV